ncbi:MAG: TIGR03905 family TSCPD domain-containing protein [Treponema sp.]|jgi:uncharacterized protein (TIGR03905 family)|nr:TIGR03905 family TSCPD domain-containing protein [Treponema sp.]
MFEYKTQGVCATKIRFDLKDDRIYSVSFERGCNGNLKAIPILVEGMEIEELLSKLKGIKCGYKNTSCADQLARAVESVR